MLFPHKLPTSKTFFLILSVQGYFFTALLFLRVLLYPLSNIDFVYDTGLLIFFFEFLNIVSSGALIGDQKFKKTKPDRFSKPFLFIFISLFVFVLFAIAKNKLLVIIFFLSFLSKIFGHKALPRRSVVATSVAVLLLSTFVVIITASILEARFSLPPEVKIMRPANTSGLFVDIPQTLLMWGVLYYAFIGVVEVMLFLKSKRNLL